MNLLITAGTGGFDSLMQAADKHWHNNTDEVFCQIGQGSYQPKHHPFTVFCHDFAARCETADVVVTHAGAATVFELLELRKPLVVVPNLERVDKHQADLAEFIERGNYAVVCRELSDLPQAVEQAAQGCFVQYQKRPFDMAESILDFFEMSGA